MPYTKDYNFEDIDEGCTIRDTIDNERQTVGQYIPGRGWQVFPESVNSKAQGVDFCVPDNRWPGRYELLIED